MEILDSKKFRTKAKGELFGGYLFYGEEDYLKRVYVERIINAAVTDFGEANIHRLDGTASADDITSAADAIPMMSEYSCVVVSDYA